MWQLYHKEGRVPKNQYIWTVVWRRLLRVSWKARRSDQSILKEINPEYSLEGLMLKLKLQYSGHLIRIADLLGKTLMVGRIEGRSRRGQQRMRWLNGITEAMDMVRWWGTGKPCMLQWQRVRQLGCWSLEVFRAFFNLSLNVAKRSSWSEPQSAPGLVFIWCIELFHLRLQRTYQSDFGIDHLVVSMCKVVSWVVGRGCLL